MALRIAPYNVAGLGVPWGATPTAAVAQSATADANYPAANIYDGQTSPVCKLASLGTDYYFDVVLNRIANGDFEQASAPSWTAVAGSVSRVASPTPFKGSYCLALTPSGVAEASCYQDVRVK